jgi:MFS family permease
LPPSHCGPVPITVRSVDQFSHHFCTVLFTKFPIRRWVSLSPPSGFISYVLSLLWHHFNGGSYPCNRFRILGTDILTLSYNIGILATIYVHPGFKIALHHPTPSRTGLITAIYYLGTWISYIFISHPASDRFGRRYAALSGVLVTCVGAALQAGATSSGALAMMIVGRIICGLGLAIVSTSVPLYQRFAPRFREILGSANLSAARYLRRNNAENMWS